MSRVGVLGHSVSEEIRDRRTSVVYMQHTYVVSIKLHPFSCYEHACTWMHAKRDKETTLGMAGECITAGLSRPILDS